MTNHYTPQQKQIILDQLRANQGNIYRTAAETGVPERTLARWRRQAEIVPPANNAGGGPPPPPPIRYQTDAAILEALRDSQAQMLALMQRLLITIPQAIEEAPLHQQVAALAQLTDRVIRLAAQLPPKDQEGTHDDPAAAVIPPHILEILDTRPDHTPSESDPGYSE
jgi:transposase-like protein